MARPRTNAGEGAGDSAPNSPLPGKVRLMAPYGFIDENDRHRFWQAGDVVGDASEVELLIERGAPIEEVE
jgi:hypothetical protein